MRHSSLISFADFVEKKKILLPEESLIQNSYLICEKYFAGVQMESAEYTILTLVAKALAQGTDAEQV
jgi:hypothetical protein